MLYINKIRISGFRSMRQVVIKDIRDLSVIFGKNDSGKSNVLRALNLFFNGETSLGQKFDPDLDICSALTSRKQVQIKIWFAKAGLSGRYKVGDNFSVRKTWSKNESPTQYSPGDKKRGPQLLDNIRFYYIPAIKSERIFQSLLGEIYAVLTKDTKFLRSLEKFASNVRIQTKALTASLQENAGIKSHLAAPTDFDSLFRTLDFKTGRKNQYSLLRQRGDGIKMRHIPEFLSFIAENTEKRFHIWGFEEPENSLEFAAALKEAEIFRQHAGNHQILVTSHSPAFYNLEGDEIQRFYVSKDVDSELSNVEVVKAHQEPASLMSESSLLVHMARRLSELRDELDELDKLKEELARHGGPILFVEGESDKIILEAAIDSLPSQDRPALSIISAGGTTKMKALSDEGIILKKLSSSKILVLADNDAEGRKACPIKGAKTTPGTWHRATNGTFWAILPFTDEYKKAMRGVNHKDKGNWNFTIEHIFESSVIEQAIGEGVLRFYQQCSEPGDAVWKRIMEAGARYEGAGRRYFYKPGAEDKVPFANWVKKHLRSEKDFGCLPALLRDAASIL